MNNQPSYPKFYLLELSMGFCLAVWVFVCYLFGDISNHIGLPSGGVCGSTKSILNNIGSEKTGCSN